MDSSRFDRLASRFASRRLTRRAALTASGTGAIGLTTVALGGADRAAVSAQDATPAVAEGGPAFLFVQLFEQGTWTPKPDEEGIYLLTLTGAGAQTLFFSDRPDRIVGTVDTSRFLEGLGFSPFNPPNAALVLRTPEGERDVLVVELFDPIYTEEFDADGGVQVTYEARILEAYRGDGLDVWVAEQDNSVLPEQFSDVSLFIDDCAGMTGCYYKECTFNSCRTVFAGDIPGGPYGRCWSWEEFNCVPCAHDDAHYNAICNKAYGSCRNAVNLSCHTGCWAGICP